MRNVYCVEDDESIRNLIIYALKNNDFDVVGFEDGRSFFNSLEELPDIILLDIMLPDEDGYEILNKLKSNPATMDIPVIMLTSKTSEFDKVKGLDMGADDYIPKPFGVMELISRINAVLRRTGTVEPEEDILVLDGIQLDVARHKVTVDVHIRTLRIKLGDSGKLIKTIRNVGYKIGE